MTIKLAGVVEAAAAYTIRRAINMAAQALTAATAAVITGSCVEIPSGGTGLASGAVYKMKLALDKTGAGTATSSYALGVVASGTDETVAANYTTLLTFTKPAGTAAADEGTIEIELLFKTVSTVAEGGSILAEFVLVHNLAATGHAQVPVVVLAASDTSTATILTGFAGGHIAVIATTGASDVSSVHYAEAELLIPAAA